MVGASTVLVLATLAASSTITVQESAGDLQASEVITQDLDGDAEMETVVVFRDADGRVARAEADSNGDGLADMWATYSTDPEGRARVELAIDRAGKGQPDEWIWTVDEVMTRVGRDTRGDGQPDVWSILDERGVVIEVQGDTDGDGLADTWSTVGPNGRTERTAYDTSGNGRADRWITYGMDGSIVSVETDTDGDGAPDEVVRQR